MAPVALPNFGGVRVECGIASKPEGDQFIERLSGAALNYADLLGAAALHGIGVDPFRRFLSLERIACACGSFVSNAVDPEVDGVRLSTFRLSEFPTFGVSSQASKSSLWNKTRAPMRTGVKAGRTCTSNVRTATRSRSAASVRVRSSLGTFYR
jgi:hypothetical protein